MRQNSQLKIGPPQCTHGIQLIRKMLSTYTSYSKLHDVCMGNTHDVIRSYGSAGSTYANTHLNHSRSTNLNKNDDLQTTSTQPIDSGNCGTHNKTELTRNKLLALP